jgi:hypothetical protein|eukprot:SAG25_NODE_1196_length_3645_cov_2.730476_4_plen_46_part_00
MPLIARWVGHIPAGRVSAVELMSGEKQRRPLSTDPHHARSIDETH